MGIGGGGGGRGWGGGRILEEGNGCSSHCTHTHIRAIDVYAHAHTHVHEQNKSPPVLPPTNILEHLETVPAALPAKPPVVSLEDKVVGVGVGFGPCEDEGDEPGAPGIHRGFEVIGGGEPAGTAAHGLLATLDQRPGSAIDDLRAT